MIHMPCFDVEQIGLEFRMIQKFRRFKQAAKVLLISKRYNKVWRIEQRLFVISEEAPLLRTPNLIVAINHSSSESELLLFFMQWSASYVYIEVCYIGLIKTISLNDRSQNLCSSIEDLQGCFFSLNRGLNMPLQICFWYFSVPAMWDG
jgi:hypothetical protein